MVPIQGGSHDGSWGTASNSETPRQDPLLDHNAALEADCRICMSKSMGKDLRRLLEASEI